MRIGVVSAYPPRRDGFAEDAQDLVRALAAEAGGVAVCAVGRPGLNYPDEVVVAVDIDELADYRRGARALVAHGIDAAVVRYSDGMYGGPHGAHILELVRELGQLGVARIISVLTVRADAPAAWTRTVAALTAGATAVLVPSESAHAHALSRRLASTEQLRVIGFGVPRAVLAEPDRKHTPPTPAVLADALWNAGPVIVTVRICGQGSLVPIVAAMRELAAQRPTVRLVVVRLGRLAEDTDQRLIDEYGLTGNVRIVDAHVPAVAFAALLARAGSYVAIGDDPELPRALAAGCPTLVVPEWTTADAAPALAGALAATLDEPHGHDRARYAAAHAGAFLGWPASARRHCEVLRAAKAATPLPVAMPGLRLDWLDRDLGRLRSFEADRDARLAAVAAALLSLGPESLGPSARRVASSWAGRTVRAFGVAAQVGFERAEAGGPRAVWGLGALAAGSNVPWTLRHRAAELRALLAANDPSNLSGAADLVLGLCVDPDLGAMEWHALSASAARIGEAHCCRGDWPVFAERLSVEHMRLAQALVAAGQRLDDRSMVDRGLETIEWLALRAGLSSTPGGMWRPPLAGPHRAVDAAAWVEALTAAHSASRLASHGRMAQQAMHWFHGANATGDAVFDAELGACRNGLGTSAPMAQLSTTATLAYLGAALSLHHAGLAELPVIEVSRPAFVTVA